MYVYAISDGTYLKIGQSLNPTRRLAALQTCSPHTLQLIGAVPETVVRERAIHARLREHQVRGEWFDKAVHDYVFRVVDTDIPFDLLMVSLAFDTRLNEAAYLVLRQEYVQSMDVLACRRRNVAVRR